MSEEEYHLLDRLLKLPAGDDLDIAVSEHVIGVDRPQQRYSSDISAAWALLDRLRKKFSNVNLCADNGWALNCWNAPEGCGPWFGGFNSETAPLAICRTAIAVALNIPSSVILEERD